MDKNRLILENTITKPVSPIKTDKYDEKLIKETIDKLEALNIKYKNGVLVVFDATHTGYVNGNYRLYDTVSEKTKNYKSFYTPYPKPHVISHFNDTLPVGRVFNAKWVPVEGGSYEGKKMEGVVKSVTYFPRFNKQTSEIVDNVLNGNLITVSTGFYAKNSICSICGIDHKNDLSGMCDHELGKMYDEKLCYHIIKEREYCHLAFATEPANEFSVGTTFVELDSKFMDNIKEITTKIYDKNTIKDIEFDEIKNNLDISDIMIDGLYRKEDAVRIYEVDNSKKIFVPNYFINNQQKDQDSIDLDQQNENRRKIKMDNTALTAEVITQLRDQLQSFISKELDKYKKDLEEGVSKLQKKEKTSEDENNIMALKIDEMREVIVKLTKLNDELENAYKNSLIDVINLSAALMGKSIDENLSSTFTKRTSKELNVVKEVVLGGKKCDDIIKEFISKDNKVPTGKVEDEKSKEIPNVDKQEDSKRDESRNPQNDLFADAKKLIESLVTPKNK